MSSVVRFLPFFSALHHCLYRYIGSFSVKLVDVVLSPPRIHRFCLERFAVGCVSCTKSSTSTDNAYFIFDLMTTVTLSPVALYPG